MPLRLPLAITLLALAAQVAPASAAACRLPAEAAAVEAAVLAMVNDQRGQKGLPPLRAEDRLRQAAQDLACDNAVNARLGHTSSDGRSMADRVDDAGYDWGELAENVALGQTGAAEVVSDWMESPPHRKNILNRAVTEAGVGVAVQADGQVHWVLNLGRPR